MPSKSEIALHFVDIAHRELAACEKEECEFELTKEITLKPYSDVFTGPSHVAEFAFQYAEAFMERAAKETTPET